MLPNTVKGYSIWYFVPQDGKANKILYKMLLKQKSETQGSAHAV
jgi:hypothetical protein